MPHITSPTNCQSAEHTSVLIVGGGLVGLSTALFLAYHNIPTVLIEKHNASSVHPRATGYTPRTMEMYRAVGLGAQIPEIPADFRLTRVRAESLAGKREEMPSWGAGKPPGPKVEYSPCLGAFLAQDSLEPILRARAEEFGADVRFGMRLVSFEQDVTGVYAIFANRDGKEQALHAEYMVAADGHRSSIREQLQIQQHGAGHLRTARSILFRAKLDAYIKDGPLQFVIKQSSFEGFLTTYNDGRWVLIFEDDQERDNASRRASVLQAVGIPDLDFEIITTGRWDLSALVADHFSAGRVFLAGDAAHCLPPNRGGYGANTGIHDAHNLAWKLAAVLTGIAGPSLLETYSAERRPVAWLRHQQIFTRPDYAQYRPVGMENEPILDDDAVEFGQLYRSTAVIGVEEDLKAVRRPDEWLGQPGTRMPHLWLSKGGKRVSTLDLVERNWVLLTEDEAWCTVGSGVAKSLRMRLQCVRIGGDVTEAEEGAFCKSFGISEWGASLIRPDGYIAWRSERYPEQAAQDLEVALRGILSPESSGLDLH